MCVDAVVAGLSDWCNMLKNTKVVSIISFVFHCYAIPVTEA